MERVYTDYTASGRQVVLNNVPAAFSAITAENVRLIFNETQKDSKGESIDPLVSTGAKENLTAVQYNDAAHTITFTLADTVPAINSGDKLTIKLDMGDVIDPVASEANATANKNAILDAISHISIDTTPLAKEATLGASPDTSVSTTIFGWLKSIRDFLVGIVTTYPYAKESSVKDGDDTTISILKDVATDAEIYAMFPGAVDENGNINGYWTINEAGYLVADFTINNGIITLN